MDDYGEFNSNLRQVATISTACVLALVIAYFCVSLVVLKLTRSEAGM